MYKKDYSNFVRPSSPTKIIERNPQNLLSGQEARRIYLDEIKGSKTTAVSERNTNHLTRGARKRRQDTISELHISDNDLLQAAQNNDTDTLIRALDTCPDKINIQDEFGWSLLMIACQANSIETVRVLLNRGIDMSVRDKAGNSAHSLVLKNRNITLADLLLSNRHKEIVSELKVSSLNNHTKVKLKEEYTCETCSNKVFPNKEEHLSSTLHNINASKGRKIPTKYVIPESNRGFQMMVRVGWDKELGLGPDGHGHKYPVRTVQKKDRKGLGNEKRKNLQKEVVNHMPHDIVTNNHERNRKMEINFRREFY